MNNMTKEKLFSSIHTAYAKNIKNIIIHPKLKLYIQTLFVFLISFYLVSQYSGQFLVGYEAKIIEHQGKESAELFYSKDGLFTSKNRKSIPYKQVINQFQTVSVNLGNRSDISSIRLDPLRNNGMVEIRNMTISYKGQTHAIDFTEIGNQNYRHNIKIIEKTSEYILLQCLGEDPHIVLTNNINFSKINLQNIAIALILTLLLHVLYRFFLNTIVLHYFDTIVLASLIFVYSCYVVLFKSPNLASELLILFAILSVVIAVKNSIHNSLFYLKHIGFFLLAYIVMSYLSIYITTEHANLEYLNEKMPYIILASLIPIGFYKINNFNIQLFKVMLTVMLILVATLIILLDHNVISINHIHFLDYVMHRSVWTQKNYMFWYVLLVFATLSFYNVKQKHDLFIVMSIIVLSLFIVFNGYSNSARLSYSVGLIFYFILSILPVKKKYLLIFIWLFTLYIIFSPIVFSLLDIFSSINALHGRNKVYNTAFALIKENWIFGYGFGSTLTIHIRDFVTWSNLPTHYSIKFFGGHPHNLSLLFWLEFGIFGALFLAYFIHKLLKNFIEKTYLYINHAALFGMIVAFDIITSFSWSIWYPQVLLTFAFFGAMLILSMNIQVKKSYPKINL